MEILLFIFSDTIYRYTDMTVHRTKRVKRFKMNPWDNSFVAIIADNKNGGKKDNGDDDDDEKDNSVSLNTSGSTMTLSFCLILTALSYNRCRKL